MPEAPEGTIGAMEEEEDEYEEVTDDEAGEEVDEGQDEEDEEEEEEEVELEEEEGEEQGELAGAAGTGEGAANPGREASEAAATSRHPAADGDPSSSAGAGDAGGAPDYTKVAKDVQSAAVEMSNKLSASFASAFSGLGAAAAAAAPSVAPGSGTPAASGGNADAGDALSKLAGGVSSWWSSLDPPKTSQRNEMADMVSASSRATSELQQLLGLAAEENLVESFKCKLLQTYGCNHNSFTPAIQMAFHGTLYVTDRHTCFTVEERNRKLPFKVPHSSVRKAVRQRPSRKGDLSDILRLEVDPAAANGAANAFLSFKDFESGSALDSALALVEHLSNESEA